MGKCLCDTYRHDHARDRFYSVEFYYADDWSRWLGVCGISMERESHNLEFSPSVCYNNSNAGLSLLYKMNLPKRVFLIGAPGSRWSGIAQDIETISKFNTSDRRSDKSYTHHVFSGHVGTYFGTGWEFDTSLDTANLDASFEHTDGTRILKSHEWAYQLDEIHERYPNDWIMLVHRPDMNCYAWWHEAGGFQIKYPDYFPYYRDSINMLAEIQRMNNAIFAFSQKHNLAWHHISSHWIETNFGQAVEPTVRLPDTLVCCLKP